MNSRRRDDDPREAYQGSAPRTRLPSSSRAEQTVLALSSRWRTLMETNQVLDPRGEILRSVQYLMNLDDPNAVELVCLRILERDRSQFGARALYSSRYDAARRDVVIGLPEDTPLAWDAALWKEKRFIAGDLENYNKADLLLDFWKSGIEDGDKETVERAKTRFIRLRAMS